MLEKLMFNPDFKIVSMIICKDKFYIATEYSVYRIHINDLTKETLFVKIAELENKK